MSVKMYKEKFYIKYNVRLEVLFQTEKGGTIMAQCVYVVIRCEIIQEIDRAKKHNFKH